MKEGEKEMREKQLLSDALKLKSISKPWVGTPSGPNKCGLFLIRAKQSTGIDLV